jgi:hypothetical protein
MSRKRWKINGYEGIRLIFETEIPNYTETEVRNILQRLLASTLSFDEIVNGSKRKRIQFDVLRENTTNHINLSCGNNPHFIASMSIITNEES